MMKGSQKSSSSNEKFFMGMIENMKLERRIEDTKLKLVS
jgi:hypothetical protein